MYFKYNDVYVIIMKTAISLMVDQLDITIHKLEKMIANNTDYHNRINLINLLDGKKKVRSIILKEIYPE